MSNKLVEGEFHFVNGPSASVFDDVAQKIYDAMYEGAIKSDGIINLQNATINMRNVTRIEWKFED